MKFGAIVALMLAVAAPLSQASSRRPYFGRYLTPSSAIDTSAGSACHRQLEQAGLQRAARSRASGDLRQVPQDDRTSASVLRVIPFGMTRVAVRAETNDPILSYPRCEPIHKLGELRGTLYKVDNHG
jgi:hypothetical protein